MVRPLIEDAFAYHAWATSVLLGSCRSVPADKLAQVIPGTFGSLMATVRHLVEGDRFQLWAAGSRAPLLHASGMGVEDLLTAANDNAAAWVDFLAAHGDADEVVVDIDDEGWQRSAPIGLRVIQAVQHGVEHRTQACTALAVLGLEPPDLSGWAFGAATGTVVEVQDGG